jgi:hypothetical protein
VLRPAVAVFSFVAERDGRLIIIVHKRTSRLSKGALV